MTLQSTDPIADLLTRVRNAVKVGKPEVRLPASKLKKIIAEQLKQNKYVSDVKIETGQPRDILVITLNDSGKNSPITEIVRISKPGRRVYVGADKIPRVKNGRGLVLVSTSKGVITGQEAFRQRLGGELLLKVY